MTAADSDDTAPPILGDCDALLGRCLVIAHAIGSPGQSGESNAAVRLFERLIEMPGPSDQKLLFLGDMLQLCDEDGAVIATIIEQARSEQEGT